MTEPVGRQQPALPTGISVQSVLPVMLFVAVNRVAGLRWAVVAATLLTLKVLIDRRRNGMPLGRFVPAITAAVLIRGAIGAITQSDAVYFGLGIATKFLGAAVLLGSVIIKRPLAAYGARYVFDVPVHLTRNRRFQSTMAAITTIAGVYYAVSATFDIWLFRRSTVEGFVLVRFLANWPLSVVAIVAVLAVAQRGLAPIPDLAPLATLIERRLDTSESEATDPMNYRQEP